MKEEGVGAVIVKMPESTSDKKCPAWPVTEKSADIRRYLQLAN